MPKSQLAKWPSLDPIVYALGATIDKEDIVIVTCIIMFGKISFSRGRFYQLVCCDKGAYVQDKILYCKNVYGTLYNKVNIILVDGW